MDKKYKVLNEICTSKIEYGKEKEPALTLVSLNADDDKVYKIDGVAMEIFEMIESSDLIYTDILDKMCEKYGEENRSEILSEGKKFLDDLLERGFIAPA